MKQILKIIAGGLFTVLCLTATPVMAIEAGTELHDTTVEEAKPTSEPQKITPTFDATTDDDEQSLRLRVGKNLLLAGNNFSSNAAVPSGLMLLAGNSLNLQTNSEYGFIFGNMIDFSGTTEKDLYVAGNVVTLEPSAKIGRDSFIAAATVYVRTDLKGSLAVTADRVVFKDVTIDGNVDLSVGHVEFAGDVKIAGRLTYNDDADIAGLNKVEAAERETYHVEEASPSSLLLIRIYSKMMSMVALFLIMALICVFYKSLHTKIAEQSTTSRFGTNLAIGLGVLIAIPVIALVALFTLVAAPLGIIALLFYAIMVYLSQGFASIWLGHMILEKLCKLHTNIYLEALVGVVILGLLSLIPYIGVATGFIAMLLGLGLIVVHVKPQANSAQNSSRKISSKSTNRTKRS